MTRRIPAYLPRFKVVLFGSEGVGKRALVERLMVRDVVSITTGNISKYRISFTRKSKTQLRTVDFCC